MSSPRIIRFVCAAALALGLAVIAFTSPVGAQDVTVSLVPEGETTVPIDPLAPTTTLPAETTRPTAASEVEATDDPNQVVVEAEPGVATRLASENRRVLAAIGGLLIVALGISILTLRYWRLTAPVPPAPEGATAGLPAAGQTGDDGLRRASRRAVAGADHAGADDDWEPRGTGEHDVVEVASRPTIVRPGAEARRRALGASSADG